MQECVTGSNMTVEIRGLVPLPTPPWAGGETQRLTLPHGSASAGENLIKVTMEMKLLIALH